MIHWLTDGKLRRKKHLVRKKYCCVVWGFGSIWLETLSCFCSTVRRVSSTGPSSEAWRAGFSLNFLHIVTQLLLNMSIISLQSHGLHLFLVWCGSFSHCNFHNSPRIWQQTHMCTKIVQSILWGRGVNEWSTQSRGEGRLLDLSPKHQTMSSNKNRIKE